MEDPMGLGGLLAPAPAIGTPDPKLKSEWDGWLQNPANRAGLLSFGLQMMSPTWGNQLAASVGAGAEAYTATQEDQQKTAERQQVRAENRGERAAARADALELKKMALEDRKTARDAATADRKAMASERQLAALMRLEASLAKQESDLAANAALFGEMSPETQARLEQLKARRASIAARIDALDAVTAGDAGGPIAGPETSVNPAAPAGPVGSPGAEAPPAGITPNPAPAAPAAPAESFAPANADEKGYFDYWKKLGLTSREDVNLETMPADRRAMYEKYLKWNGGGTPAGAPVSPKAGAGKGVDPGAAELVKKYPDKVDAILARPDADAALKKAGIPFTAQQLKAARDLKAAPARAWSDMGILDILKLGGFAYDNAVGGK